MGENAIKKSQKETFMEGFKGRNPDVNVDDEEAFYGGLQNEYDSREQQLARTRDLDEKMNKMFEENPTSAYFLNDLMSGNNTLAVSLLKNFGPVIKAALDDPTEENQKAFADAMEEYSKRIKETEEIQAQFEKNVEDSDKTIEEWCQQNNVNDEQLGKIKEFISTQFANYLSGITTTEMLDFALRGINYEKDVTAAEQNGRAAGRTERIKETMRKGKGDGMPMMAGGGKAGEKPNDNFLASAQQEDPWAKAKRVKY